MSELQIRTLAATIFYKAAEYIRQHGWQVEGMSSHGQPRCSMGALASAYPEVKWDSRLASFMYATLYKELGGMSLTEFNHRHKDGEKVASLYEQVAAKLQ
jgi:hypothetical protein